MSDDNVLNLQEVELKPLNKRFYFEKFSFAEFEEKAKQEAYALHMGDDAVYQLMVYNPLSKREVEPQFYKILVISVNPQVDREDLFLALERHLRQKFSVEIIIIRETIDVHAYVYWSIPEEKFPQICREIQALK